MLSITGHGSLCFPRSSLVDAMHEEFGSLYNPLNHAFTSDNFIETMYLLTFAASKRKNASLQNNSRPLNVLTFLPCPSSRIVNVLSA